MNLHNTAHGAPPHQKQTKQCGGYEMGTTPGGGALDYARRDINKHVPPKAHKLPKFGSLCVSSDTGGMATAASETPVRQAATMRQRCGGGRECRTKKKGVISCETSALCGGGAALQRQASGVAAHVKIEAVIKKLETEGCLEKGLQNQTLFSQDNSIPAAALRQSLQQIRQ
jgi:hypothetical protein